jgi:hypothetical protein
MPDNVEDNVQLTQFSTVKLNYPMDANTNYNYEGKFIFLFISYFDFLMKTKKTSYISLSTENNK